MDIQEISSNKKQFLNLLLLADEQESMIERYLERGRMFILYDSNQTISVCVITDEGNGVLEIKNIAVYPEYQRRGYGKRFISFLFEYFRHKYKEMIVGTGDSPQTTNFYTSCGFRYSHRIPNFFIENYDHPIFENGKQLIDMIYFKKDF